MNKFNQIAVCSILTLGVVGATYAGQTTPALPLQKPAFLSLQSPHKSNFQRLKIHKHHNFSHSWRHALRRTKTMTPAQAKIVARAAVILYGDSNLQVSAVMAVPGKHGRHNYRIKLSNKQGKAVTSILMNGINGRIIQHNQ